MKKNESIMHESYVAPEVNCLEMKLYSRQAILDQSIPYSGFEDEEDL